MNIGTLFLIHGIGEQKPGYSKEWQENIRFYLGSTEVDFVEIYWQDAFKKAHIKKKTKLQIKLYNTLLDILTRKIEKEKIFFILTPPFPPILINQPTIFKFYHH